MKKRKARCRSCGADIFWALSKKTRSDVPIDWEVRADGNISIGEEDGELWAHFHAKPQEPSLFPQERFVTHFATCDHSNAWRGSSTRRKPKTVEEETEMSAHEEMHGRKR